MTPSSPPPWGRRRPDARRVSVLGFPDAKLLGRDVARVEDRALIRGAGRFVDDIALPGMLHVAFVRSPHAHAKITGIDTEFAASMPGVPRRADPGRSGPAI